MAKTTSKWRRAVHYGVLKLRRLPSSPRAIASGLGIGMGVSFFPVLGAHTILAILLAWLTRSNVVAAVIGTALGFFYLPLMFLTYFVGHKAILLMGHTPALPPTEIHFAMLVEAPGDFFRDLATNPAEVWPFIEALLVGSLICGLAAYLAVMLCLPPLLKRWRQQRTEQLKQKRGMR